METLADIRSTMGGDPEEFNRFVHFSWCIKELGVSYKINPNDMDDIYTGLVSGVIGNLGSGKTPEFIEELSSMKEDERFSKESYMKLFYCMVEYGRHLNPYEEWVVKNPESDEWINYILEATELSSSYEEDPEKWLLEFRHKMTYHFYGNKEKEKDEQAG